jgi:hypothetical protein
VKRHTFDAQRVACALTPAMAYVVARKREFTMARRDPRDEISTRREFLSAGGR